MCEWSPAAVSPPFPYSLHKTAPFQGQQAIFEQHSSTLSWPAWRTVTDLLQFLDPMWLKRLYKRAWHSEYESWEPAVGRLERGRRNYFPIPVGCVHECTEPAETARGWSMAARALTVRTLLHWKGTELCYYSGDKSWQPLPSSQVRFLCGKPRRSRETKLKAETVVRRSHIRNSETDIRTLCCGELSCN